MNREDIIVSPLDVYIASKTLGMQTEDFSKEYTTVTLGKNSGLPLVLMKMNDKGFCTLLEFDSSIGRFKCRVHGKAQPFACSSHPVGRMTTVVKNKSDDASLYDIFKSEYPIKYEYVLTGMCPTSTKDAEEHTVAEWMKDNKRSDDEEYWNRLIQFALTKHVDMSEFRVFTIFIGAYPYIADKFEKLTKNDVKVLKQIRTIFVKTYAVAAKMMYDFDINEDFVEQAKKRVADLEKLSKTLQEIFESGIDMYKDVGISKEYILSQDWLEDAQKAKEEEEKNG